MGKQRTEAKERARQAELDECIDAPLTRLLPNSALAFSFEATGGSRREAGGLENMAFGKKGRS